MLKILGYLALAIALLAIGFLAYVRFAGHDPAVWHVDPVTAPTPETPNSYRVVPPGSTVPASGRVSPTYSATPAELMTAFEAHALAQPDTIRLAGSSAEGFTTFVQRTPTVKYPDYISVRAVPAGEGQSALVILSRSRYGKSDMGVNKARIDDWLAAPALAKLEVGAGPQPMMAG